eukprot:524411-Alexandrium_andersonii.AAC.1
MALLCAPISPRRTNPSVPSTPSESMPCAAARRKLEQHQVRMSSDELAAIASALQPERHSTVLMALLCVPISPRRTNPSMPSTPSE